MTLDEIFEKYDGNNEIQFIRKSIIEYHKKQIPDISEEEIKKLILTYGIEFFKSLKEWGKEEYRKIGFWVPQFIIDDSNADDWEVFE